VRRGGTISLIGVYGGQSDPMPLLTLFDKQIQLRMGQANVKRWVDDIMPLVLDDDDPLGTETFATHQVPLEEAPEAYQKFQAKTDGTIKVCSSREPAEAAAATARNAVADAAGARLRRGELQGLRPPGRQGRDRHRR